MPGFSHRVAALAVAAMLAGCASYQPTKDVWKGTKDFWNTYVSVPARVDFGEKGDLSPRALALTTCMMGLDVELGRLERVMLNADKAPTMEWMEHLFDEFPWLAGVAGVRNDGTLLGHEPPGPVKQLDYIPLLYEDAKQSSRALRADVQASELGPEIMLGVPLYDGVHFLGVVAVHFDVRALLPHSMSHEDIVIISPHGLIWPGRFDYAATPLAGVVWEEAVRKASTGTCRNDAGAFHYMVRYLGNLPLVFAVVESGDFPSAPPEQSLAFFPKEREKLPPPPLPADLPEDHPSRRAVAFGAPADGLPDVAPAEAQGGVGVPGAPGMLLEPPSAEAPGRQGVQERRLEGDNVRLEPPRREQRQARPQRRVRIDPRALDVPDLPDPGQSFDAPQQKIERPSPFGPRGGAPAPAETSPLPESPAPSADSAPAAPARPAPAPEAPAAPAAPAPEAAPSGAPEAASAPAEETPPVGRLRGGRPSPFGPR